MRHLDAPCRVKTFWLFSAAVRLAAARRRDVVGGRAVRAASVDEFVRRKLPEIRSLNEDLQTRLSSSPGLAGEARLDRGCSPQCRIVLFPIVQFEFSIRDSVELRRSHERRDAA